MSSGVSRQNLLIVDDDRAQLRTLTDIFTGDGFQVTSCETIDDALEACRVGSFMAAILDLKLRDRDGIELLQGIRELQPEMRAIVHTAYGSFDSAKDAVNLGAFAYVEKRGEPSELISQVHRAIEDRLTTALHESETRMQHLLDDVSAIVWECEFPSCQFTYVSQHAESILGFPAEQWLTQPDFRAKRLHEDDHRLCAEFCESLSDTDADRELEYRMIAADGSTVWVQDVVHVVSDDNGTPVKLRGVMIDITKRKAAEEKIQELATQLTHVSRLSMMGQLLAGIAHELNQPLSAIANFASACRNTIESSETHFDAPVQGWLKQISQQAIRCGDIIRTLRSFANKGDQEREEVDLVTAIEESITFVRNDLKRHAVNIRCELPSERPKIRSSKVLIQQVIVNLLLNACEATSETRDPTILVRLEAGPDSSRVTIQDNGPGVDRESESKLFDAFYTTKQSGMGIGLAISRSIIETHHGTLRLDPASTSGARFYIDLPALSPLPA